MGPRDGVWWPNKLGRGRTPLTLIPKSGYKGVFDGTQIVIKIFMCNNINCKYIVYFKRFNIIENFN